MFCIWFSSCLSLEPEGLGLQLYSPFASLTSACESEFTNFVGQRHSHCWLSFIVFFFFSTLDTSHTCLYIFKATTQHAWWWPWHVFGWDNETTNEFPCCRSDQDSGLDIFLCRLLGEGSGSRQAADQSWSQSTQVSEAPIPSREAGKVLKHSAFHVAVARHTVILNDCN